MDFAHTKRNRPQIHYAHMRDSDVVGFATY